MWAWILLAAMLDGGAAAGDGLLVTPGPFEIAPGRPWADLTVRRLRPTEGRLVAVAPDGRRSEVPLDGWWVLAGGARVHGIELPFPACTARELSAVVRIGGTELVARAEECAP